FPQFGQRVAQRFGNKAAAVRAEMTAHVRQVVRSGLMQGGFIERLSLGEIAERIEFFHDVLFVCQSVRIASAARTAEMKARIFATSLMPFACSTPLLTSTAWGRMRCTASVAFCALKPPLKTARGARFSGMRDQSKTFPLPP